MSTKSTSGKNTTPKNSTTKIVEGDWTYVQDSYGDWRGTNERAGLRTRLKFTLTWAKYDVKIKRLQKQQPDGKWADVYNN